MKSVCEGEKSLVPALLPFRLFWIMLVSFCGCTVPEYPLSVPEIETGTPREVTLVSAVIEGAITESKGNTITETGHCWSSSDQVPEADKNEGKTSFSFTGNKQVFISELSGLSAGRTYYIRAYARYGTSVCYGEATAFQTTALRIPAVTTTGKRDESTTSAVVSGRITDTGNTPLSQHGHCWSSVNPLPTTLDSKTESGAASGPVDFNSEMTGLSPNTTYYVRAYAVNQGGAGYGNVITVQTRALTLPVVRLNDYARPDPYTIRLNGYLESIGSAPVTEMGFVYSDSREQPTLSDVRVSRGGAAAPATFDALLNGLQPNTAYYIRAFATSAAGTAYSAPIKVTTLAIVLPAVSTPVTNLYAVGLNTTYNLYVTSSVTSSGNLPVTFYGFVWSTTQTEPQRLTAGTTQSLIVAGQPFRSDITGVACGTTVYIRAWAINSAGTVVYSPVRTFLAGCPPK